MSMSPRVGRQDLESMRDRLDRLIGEFGGRTAEFFERSMPVDVFESDNRVVVSASVPGVKPEQLEIQYTDGMLTIHTSVEEESVSERGTWHIRERRTGSYERSIPLPRSADVEKAEATLDDGVLTITFPIAEQSAKRRIEIKAGNNPLEP
jgi:HSP20 family protein